MNKKLVIVLVGAFAFGTYAVAVRGQQPADGLRFTSIAFTQGDSAPVFEVGDVSIVKSNDTTTKTTTYEDRVEVMTTNSRGESDVITRDLEGKVLRHVTSKDFSKFLHSEGGGPMLDMIAVLTKAGSEAKEIGKGKFRGQPCTISQMEYDDSGTKTRMVMWQPDDERLADAVGTLKSYMYEVGGNGELKLEFGKVVLLK